MENLIMPGTKTTPYINFSYSGGVMEFSGESYPENATEFYKPVYEWLKRYFQNDRKLTIINFKLIYFNTSSSKAVLDILDYLDDMYTDGHNIIVNWYYLADDEDILESGQEFAEGLKIPFNLISYD